MPSTVDTPPTDPAVEAPSDEPVASVTASEENKASSEHTENIKDSLNKYFNKSEDPLEKELETTSDESKDAGLVVTPEMIDGYLVATSSFIKSMEDNAFVQTQPWIPQYVIPGSLTTITYAQKAVPPIFVGIQRFNELRKEFEQDVWAIFVGLIYLFAGGRLMFAMLASQVFMSAAWPFIKKTGLTLYADYEKIQALLTKKDIAMFSDVITGKRNPMTEVMAAVNDVKTQVADVAASASAATGDVTGNIDVNNLDVDSAKAKAEEMGAKAQEMAEKTRQMQRGAEEMKQKLEALMEIMDPSTITEGFNGVYTGMMAVCALVNPTVRGISTGAAIGDNLHKFLLPFVTPLLEKHVPIKNAHKWVLELLTYTCKAIGVFVGLALSRFSMFFMTASKGAEKITEGIHYLLTERLKRPGLESAQVKSGVQTGLTVVGFVCQAVGYIPYLFWLICLPGFALDSILQAILLDQSE